MARGAIAAGHELTARAGAAALEAGGTAVDAVVAAGAMSWAAEPALTGPCGGGFVMVRPARGKAALLDAFTAIPGRDLPAGRRLVEVEHVLVPFDQRTTQVFHIGSAACAVPGVVAGLHAAHRRYGRLAWAELVRPAAATAARGVPTNDGQRAVFDAIRAILTSTPEASAIFAPGGRYVREGDVIVQKQLAGTIELLADDGPDVLYRGRAGAGDGRPPAPARRPSHDGRSGVIPAGVAAAAAVGLRRARADHERAAVVGRRPDRLHAGGAGAVRAGAPRRAGGCAAGAGGVDAGGGTAARRALRAAAAQGRAGGAPAVAGAGAGGAA